MEYSKEHNNVYQQGEQQSQDVVPTTCLAGSEAAKKDMSHTGTGWNNALLREKIEQGQRL